MQTILKENFPLVVLHGKIFLDFHSPAMRFINSLFKHVLLCKWSDDYLQTSNCLVNESRITNTSSWVLKITESSQISE